MSDDLIIERVAPNFVFDSLALIGGHFGALRIIFTYLFSFTMPAMVQLEVVKNAFRVKRAREDGEPDLADRCAMHIKERRSIKLPKFANFRFQMETCLRCLLPCSLRQTKVARMVSMGAP